MNKYAICLITNNLYSDGVCVVIKSFLDTNEWFNGDIVIIDYGYIDDYVKRKISCLYENVIFKQANDPRYEQIKERVFEMQKENKTSIYAFPYLYKAEAFGLEGYDRVVFFDSDLVIFDDIKYLFENKYDFAVVRDDYNDADYFSKSEKIREKGELINSGVISIKAPQKWMFDEILNEALNLKPDEIYAALCYEQDSISKFLDKQHVVLLPFLYNFPQVFFVYNESSVITTQKIIHYYGPFKPWDNKDSRANYINSFYNNILEEVNEITKKLIVDEWNRKVKLVFHLYGKEAKEFKIGTETKSNKIHREILSLYSHKFSSAVFYISLDDTSDNNIISAAVEWIISCGFKNLEIKIVQNDSFRESRTFFSEVINKLYTLNEYILFSHNKGCTHNDERNINENVLKWIIYQYYSIFGNFDLRINELETFGLLCGYVPIFGAKEPWDYYDLNKYAWHIPGTIELINPFKLREYLNRTNQECPNLENYLSAEMFFGNIYDIVSSEFGDNYCIMFEGKKDAFFITEYFNPYEVSHPELISYFLEEKKCKEYEEFYEKIEKKL